MERGTFVLVRIVCLRPVFPKYSRSHSNGDGVSDVARPIKETKATFFITTARSGTQWLAQSLSRLYPTQLCVTHEPVGYAYKPREFLRAKGAVKDLKSLPVLSRHIDYIHATLRERSYVEVGFPGFALAPLLRQEFPGRFQLIQLVRNPITVAASLVTHGWYCGDSDGHHDVELTPFDPGVLQKAYGEQWSNLSPYEKALFYWSEVHLFGIEYQTEYPETPFLTIRSEELFTDSLALDRVTDFLGLPIVTDRKYLKDKSVDRFQYRTSRFLDWRAITRHPSAMELAGYFGYDVESIDEAALNARYISGRSESLPRRVFQRWTRLKNLLTR